MPLKKNNMLNSTCNRIVKVFYMQILRKLAFSRLSCLTKSPGVPQQYTTIPWCSVEGPHCEVHNIMPYHTLTYVHVNYRGEKAWCIDAGRVPLVWQLGAVRILPWQPAHVYLWWPGVPVEGTFASTLPWTIPEPTYARLQHSNEQSPHTSWVAIWRCH